MLIPVRTGEGPATRRVVTRWRTRIALETWVLATLIAIGAILRFATISSQSYWFDEAQAAHELHLSFGAMLSAWSSGEPNPPLYFVLGWFWAQLFGTGEAGLRAFSALLGTAAIPIAYLCGRELVSRRAGLVAAALAAVNPFLIWYSQEAREYALLVVLCGASFLFFARCWREPSTRNIVWWAVFSALALLTQYFALFIVGAEAAMLLYRVRERAMVVATVGLVLVEAALLPHAIGHASHPRGWITSFPLSIRIQQVPIAFGLGTLYQSSIVNDGLLGAAVLAGALIVLLVVGANSQELRGAGLAAAVAAAVLLVPLLLALAGRDYYEARALIPAWIPLAVVVGAACTVRRLQPAGALLGLLLLGSFVYAGIRIGSHAVYQRPPWRQVAAALGVSSVPRGIVAYDGTFATAPLALYVPGVAWTSSSQIPQTSHAAATVDEIDVVGNVWQSIARPLPAGVRLLSSKGVKSYQVARFLLPRPERLTPGEIGARASALLGPAGSGRGVLLAMPGSS
jgi:mannosyltransferase